MSLDPPLKFFGWDRPADLVPLHEVASHVALVANVIGIADATGVVSNTEFMLLSVFD